MVYSAVTIGEAWRFGRLDQVTRTVVQDIALYTVPTQLDILMKVSVGLVNDNMSSQF